MKARLTQTLRVRLTRAERRELERQARSYGATVSEHVRVLIELERKNRLQNVVATAHRALPKADK